MIHIYVYTRIHMCLVTQSCPTLCDPMDCSPPCSSVHGNSPGKNTGVGCRALLQEIFPTQASNLNLMHCRWILYCLSHQGSPHIYTHTYIYISIIGYCKVLDLIPSRSFSLSIFYIAMCVC